MRVWGVILVSSLFVFGCRTSSKNSDSNPGNGGDPTGGGSPNGGGGGGGGGGGAPAIIGCWEVLNLGRVSDHDCGKKEGMVYLQFTATTTSVIHNCSMGVITTATASSKITPIGTPNKFQIDTLEDKTESKTGPNGLCRALVPISVSKFQVVNDRLVDLDKVKKAGAISSDMPSTTSWLDDLQASFDEMQ